MSHHCLKRSFYAGFFSLYKAHVEESEGAYIGTQLSERRVQRRVVIKRPVKGAVAQLGERLPCTQEVVGSIPSGSTIFKHK